MSTDTKCENEETIECPVESIIECPVECSTCNGSGTIYPPPMVGLNIIGGINCPKCKGIGSI